jgi:hypothetical protein
MIVALSQLGGGVLPVLGQFVLPALVGAVVLLVVVRDVRRRGLQREREEDDVLPLLIVPRSGVRVDEQIRPAPLALPAAPEPLLPASPAPEPARALEPPRAPPGFPEAWSRPPAPRAPEAYVPPLPRLPEVDPGSETISIDLIGAGTVQLLPGRLEVVRGMERGREYRFVRTAGQLITEVTLGRSTGPAHRHVQLPVPTVSRMHARLRHEGGRWTITNLSLTNPVRVNDRELFGREDSKPLEDGDRITIGEVELCFWTEG